jgi:hypothetical protein
LLVVKQIPLIKIFRLDCLDKGLDFDKFFSEMHLMNPCTKAADLFSCSVALFAVYICSCMQGVEFKNTKTFKFRMFNGSNIYYTTQSCASN